MPIPLNGRFEAKVQSLAYAGSVTPNADIADIVNVGQLTGNITINAPTATGVQDGQQLRFRFSTDSTAGRTINWNSVFAFGTHFTTANIPTTASSKFELMFSWHAGDSKWRAMSLAFGF